MKKIRAKTIFRYLCLSALILEMIVLCIEALRPGTESSKSSNAVGDTVDLVLTELSDDAIRDRKPTGIAVLSGGEEVRTLSLSPGESAALSVSYLPKDTSVNYRETAWSSADDRVATVRNGKVTAVGLGKTTIYVRLTALPELRAEVTVDVREVLAEDFSLLTADGAEECRVETGNTAVLAPQFTPAGATDTALTYASEDETVATVSPFGIVEGVSAGDTAVTATYSPASDPDFVLTRRIPVHVAESPVPAVPLRGVVLGCADAQMRDDGTYQLYLGDTGSLSAALAPQNTTQTALRFESSDPDLVSVDPATGEYTVCGKGRAEITVRAANGLSDVIRFTFVNRTLGGIVLKGGTLEKTGDAAYSLKLKAGVTGAVLAAEAPDRYLRFRSSDEQIVKVYESGLIAALSSSQKAEGGVVTLTVTLSDNPDFDDANGDLTASYTIVLTVEKQAFSEGVSGWSLLIRKLFGHFGAFLVLGLLAAGTAIFFDRGTWRGRFLTVGGLTVFGFTFACFTELLQMDLFTTGRAAAFSDVIIDFSGYWPAAIIVYLAFLLTLAIVALVRLSKKQNAQAPQDERTDAQTKSS